MSMCPLVSADNVKQPVYLRVIDQVLMLVNDKGEPLGAQISVTASCAVDQVQQVVVTIAHQGYWEEQA